MTRKHTPVKYCRHCGQMIAQDAVDCPYCEKNTIKMPDQKECPFCGEMVKGKALKCKHCGEFIDGRPAREEGRQVLYIDKAVIAGTDEEGRPQITSPEPGQITAGGAAPDSLLDTPRRQALPPGTEEEDAGLPVPVETRHLPERIKGKPPAPRGEAAPPAKAPPRKPQKRRRKRKKKEEKGPGEGVEVPEARYECPSCGRYVFEKDNFCENCGRDLSIPRGRKEVLGPGRHYQPADYALMIGAGAPLGLLFEPKVAAGIAAVAGLVALWCLWRILTSHGALRGAGSAAAGLFAAGFWAWAVLAFT